ADRPGQHDDEGDQEGRVRAHRRSDTAGESSEPPLAWGRVHGFNLAARPLSATLRKPEVLERDLDARTPVTEVRLAERPQACRGREVLIQVRHPRREQAPWLVAHRASPERRPQGARVELVPLDQELLQGTGLGAAQV